jgi:hypothetical protein
VVVVLQKLADILGVTWGAVRCTGQLFALRCSHWGAHRAHHRNGSGPCELTGSPSGGAWVGLLLAVSIINR